MSAITRPPMRNPVELLRRRIEQRVHAATRPATGFALDLDTPPGDPGLFGPDAVCWTIHDDFPAMMIGGIRALILQALHPLALAGVLEHSIFLEDMRGRLARTAQFIAGTTFGSVRDANGLIDRVNRIHGEIVGVAPDGRPYAARDPALLRWVHVAEVSSFLAAYLAYADAGLSAADQDRYVAETATIARRLGATEVPETRAALDACIDACRPQWVASARMHAAIDQLLTHRDASRADRHAMRLFVAAAVQLLPPAARTLMAGAPGRRHALVVPTAHVASRVLRWAIRQTAGRRARARVAEAVCNISSNPGEI